MLSQAAPMNPPPEGLRQAMADAILNQPAAHVYGPALGLPALRETLAMQWASDYGGSIWPENVAITAGCNMAFTSAISTLAGAGDAVMMPVPWYFNHKMWLDMASIDTVPMAMGPDLLPDPDAAANAITPRIKAIVLVTPNNPAGVEYPPALLDAFFDLAERHGIALILDETYRDFGAKPADAEGWPHRLFARPNWDRTLIHLYSFSKAFRMTGHRLGAIVASEARLKHVEKVLDTVQICAPQVAQLGALWGLQNLREWLADERLEVRRRHDRVVEGFAAMPAWTVKGSGAYFAYVEHPFDERGEAAAKRLLSDFGLLTLPGTMFAPTEDAEAGKVLRFAYANATLDVLETVFARLSDAAG